MSEGLVQRKRRTQKEEELGGQPNAGNDSDDGRGKEAEDGDSKETRLTLMEEVLLLGLKDKVTRVARYFVVQRGKIYQIATKYTK
jgi:hypothetical protein